MPKDKFSIGNESLPSIVNNPFLLNSITAINIFYRQKLFSRANEWECEGYIKFRNGSTSGEQRFNAPTFDEVVLMIKGFLQTLIENEKQRSR